MHRQGQITGVFTLLFLDLTFIILWALVLGELVAIQTAAAIATGNLEAGMETFLIANLNLFIWAIFIIANLVGFVMMRGQQ